MAKQSKGNKQSPQSPVEILQSRSLPLAEAGPQTVMDIAELSMAVACDVIRGLVSANSANATASSIGKALKAIELQLKHGPKDKVHVMLK